MNVKCGDLLQHAEDGLCDVIVHGCNCFCTMGSGVAKQIKDKYPQAYEADKRTISGDWAKLGGISISSAKNKNDETFYIVNAYTQYNYGTEKVQVDYDKLRECFQKVKENFSGKRIAYPAIGCGLAGGDWSKVSKIIDEELSGEDHTYIEYKDG